MQDAKTKSRAYFNRHRKSALAHGGYWNWDYRHILDKVEVIRPNNLIDIGCGPGGFLSAVHQAFPGIELHALDLSEEMVGEVQRRLGSSVQAAVGDAEAMPLSSGRFDAVTCTMSIHHYPHPQAAVNEMHRILRPGGTLLLNDMDCAQPIRAAANVLFPRLPGGDVKMYNRNEILDMMAQAGFKVVSYRKNSPVSFLCIAEKPPIG